MRLAEIMSTQVVTTPPDRSFAEAREEMHRRDLHHLIVVDGGHVVGVVSAHDTGETVRDAMHGHVVSATTNTTVRAAANLLRGHTIGCLPVFDGDQLAGIVTISDLLDLIGRGVERPVAETIPWTLGRRPARAPKRR